MQACDRCHQRAGAPCVQTDKFNLRPLPRAYVESLESNLRLAEAEKQRLADELAALRSSRVSVDQPTVMADQQLAPGAQSDVRDESGSVSLRDFPDERATDLANDMVASEAGYLSLKAMGENRHLGISNGITFAGIVTSLLQSSNLSLSANKGDANGRNAGATAPAAPKDTAAPSQEAAMPSVEAYFNHWHLIFPVIHRPHLIGIVDRIYADDDFYKAHAFEAFLFDMVLAMGTASLNRLDWSTASPEVHYIRALGKLEEVLTMNGLVPLQAILLVCQYGIFCSLRDTSASMWHLVGIAVRLCVEMGLHRESRLGDPSIHGSGDLQVNLELEMRRRCFWCLHNLDRIVSVTLGRPLGLRDEDIDMSLPSPLVHEDIGSVRGHTRGGSVESNSTSPFLHVIAIRKLAGKILQTVNCTAQNRSMPDQQRLAIRQSLHEELDTWKAGIASVNLTPPGQDERTSSSFLWATWYEIPYHNALLLLYRPSSLFPSTSASADGQADEWRAALNQIFTSSKSVIYLYAELHRTRRLNYSWITLHAVFMAGLAYVYCISRIIKDRVRNGGELPACLDYTCIIADTRACSNLLVAINERWGAARSSCEIFERLSTAIIQDAVKARLNTDQRRHAAAARAHSPSMMRGEPCPVNQTGGGLRFTDPSLASDTFMPDSPRATGSGTTNQLTPPDQHQLSAAVGFRQFYQDLQGGPPGSLQYDYEMVPSEVITGFSQDWFGGENVPNFAGSSDAPGLWQTMGFMDSS